MSASLFVDSDGAIIRRNVTGSVRRWFGAEAAHSTARDRASRSVIVVEERGAKFPIVRRVLMREWRYTALVDEGGGATEGRTRRGRESDDEDPSPLPRLLRTEADDDPSSEIVAAVADPISPRGVGGGTI